MPRSPTDQLSGPLILCEAAMRSVYSVIVALSFPLALFAQDSTAAPRADETLTQRLGLHGIHMSQGGGSSPYMGRREGEASTGEIRIGVTPHRWPDWTIAFAFSGVGNWDTTSYVVPSSDGSVRTWPPRPRASNCGGGGHREACSISRRQQGRGSW